MNPPGLTGDQQDWSRKCGIRAFFDIVVEYDDKRCGWWFRGLGFDFWAHFAGGHLEAEVCRDGDDPDSFVLHLSIALGSAERITADVFASKCLKELGRYWDLFGELEGAAQ